MTKTIETPWGPLPFESQPYWHMVGTPRLFYNNVRIGEGAVLSVSLAIETQPHIHDAQTPYSFARRDAEKENVFEEIRHARYPHRPSRLKTLYVFDDYKLVERALIEWFPNEHRAVHECRVWSDSNVHKADSTWLNALPKEWAVNAEKYWGGGMSEKSFPEVLVHGILYFPGWEDFSDA